jgi:hypothetical protein
VADIKKRVTGVNLRRFITLTSSYILYFTLQIVRLQRLAQLLPLYSIHPENPMIIDGSLKQIRPGK